MAGNSFGKNFRVTTWGESHGSAVGAVIDGCPAGLMLSEDDFKQMMNRRRPEKRKELDNVKILSGVFEGQTTGMPVSLIIENNDVNADDYTGIKDIYRPGHADFTYDEKYGIRDYRGGGRSSGRETASRVAAGVIALKILSLTGVEIKSSVERADTVSDGDSVGAKVRLVISNVPKGLGSPVFDKLDADLAKAVMSIGAVKAVEIGAGVKASRMKGSESNDEYYIQNGDIKKKTNNAGGISGGISDGDDIIITLHFKPTPSVSVPQHSVNKSMEEVEFSINGRHDECIGERGAVVAEAMSAIVLVDALMENMYSRIENLVKFYE